MQFDIDEMQTSGVYGNDNSVFTLEIVERKHHVYIELARTTAHAVCQFQFHMKSLQLKHIKFHTVWTLHFENKIQ